MNKYKRVEKVIQDRKQNGGIQPKFGYRGVQVDNRPNRKPYRSYFSFSDKNKKIQISLGAFDTPEEAYIARLKFIESLK